MATLRVRIAPKSSACNVVYTGRYISVFKSAACSGARWAIKRRAVWSRLCQDRVRGVTLPPFITDLMDDLLGTAPGDESGYRNSSVYQRFKVMASVNRQSTAAELAYLYQREDYYINYNSPRAIQSHQNNPPTTYQQASASQIDEQNHYDFPTSLSLVEFHKQL